MKFDFNREKNEKIFIERGITFEDVIEAIARRGVLLNFDNPNKEKYPNQKILVVDVNGYAYCVPYVIQEDDTWFLKTIYPSRKFKTLIGGKHNEKI